MSTSRADHLAWCKRRALEYVDAGDLAQALASMTSDLGKHPDTASPGLPVLMAEGLLAVQRGDAAHMRRWINGFN